MCVSTWELFLVTDKYEDDVGVEMKYCSSKTCLMITLHRWPLHTGNFSFKKYGNFHEGKA